MHIIDIVSLWLGRIFVWGIIATLMIFILAIISGQVIRFFKYSWLIGKGVTIGFIMSIILTLTIFIFEIIG
jgi:hypothetical protein